MRSMKVQKDGDSVAVLFLDRQIGDEARIMEIGDELSEIASNVPAGKKLILDLQNLEYFSSAMVGQLAQLRNAAIKSKIDLRLRNISAAIQDILRAMHMDKLFRIEAPES